MKINWKEVWHDLYEYCGEESPILLGNHKMRIRQLVEEQLKGKRHKCSYCGNYDCSFSKRGEV